MRRTGNKHERRLFCSYLYSNGALVKWFEEFRADSAGHSIKIGSTVDITYGYADLKIVPGYRNHSYEKPTEGRVVIDRYRGEALLALVKGARVEAVAPSNEGGSENTRRQGIRVGYFNVHTKKGELSWLVFDNFISSGITIQPSEGKDYKFPVRDDGAEWQVGMLFWSDSTINKIVDLRPVQPGAGVIHEPVGA